MMEIKAKRAILEAYTTEKTVIEELCQYTTNKFFEPISDFDVENFNTVDDAHITDWERYFEESKQIGVFETLKKYLVQLQFPISEDISQSLEYRGATLKGIETSDMNSAIGLQLNCPSGFELLIHNSIAGKIPVLLISNDQDFVSIIQALTYKNEPVSIPQSMGAAMINGLNNWDRIRQLKKNWLKENPFGNWNMEFAQNVVPNKPLYQDKLIVLSKKNYSGVHANSLGLSQEEWIQKSIKIRLEHECAHFFTLKLFGKMANNMHDELIADYMGISQVLGKFNKDWFLSFIGLENFPDYREGGRLQNYLGKPIISKESAVILRAIIQNAAINVALFDKSVGSTFCLTERSRRLLTICALDLVAISSNKGYEMLMNQYSKFPQLV